MYTPRPASPMDAVGTAASPPQGRLYQVNIANPAASVAAGSKSFFPLPQYPSPYVSPSPVIDPANSVVYAVGNNAYTASATIYAVAVPFAAAGPTARWSYALTGVVESSPAVSRVDGSIYVATVLGRVSAPPRAQCPHPQCATPSHASPYASPYASTLDHAWAGTYWPAGVDPLIAHHPLTSRRLVRWSPSHRRGSCAGSISPTGRFGRHPRCPTMAARFAHTSYTSKHHPLRPLPHPCAPLTYPRGPHVHAHPLPPPPSP